MFESQNIGTELFVYFMALIKHVPQININCLFVVIYYKIVSAFLVLIL